MRSRGWIHTLLEEAENERMHLLTFLTLKEKNHLLFRMMVMGGQACLHCQLAHCIAWHCLLVDLRAVVLVTLS